MPEKTGKPLCETWGKSKRRWRVASRELPFLFVSHQKSQHTKDGSSTGGGHTWQLWIKERYMVT